jgi:hypothetical protein
MEVRGGAGPFPIGHPLRAFRAATQSKRESFSHCELHCEV